MTKKGPSLKGQFLNAIYPPVCGICGKLSQYNLCNKCKIKLQEQAIFQIEDYRNNSSYFNEHIYMFKYSGEIRNAILNYKFNEKSYIYKTFVNILKKNQKKCAQIQKYDIIIPVPISKKRLKQRGYNQSELFAKKIAELFKIKYEKNVLIKIKDNKIQSTLNREQRKENVQNVYIIKNNKKLYNKKVLLVDDVFTTGNTANECSRLLIKNFAKVVGLFTIAKD